MSSYNETELDKKNFGWFNNNKTCNTLQKIAVEQSSIRGLGLFEIEFKYPITVIVGENGCGKSTVLSLVSCAFHNNSTFCPMSLLSNKKKQQLYYTFRDFFAFTKEENGFLKDIRIKSTFLTDKPKCYDVRRKAPRGKWIDYDSRPKRAVSFLGINRILPPSESMTYRNYSNRFGVNSLTCEESRSLSVYMTRIFGKEYSDITLRTHHKYRLYGCNKNATLYTGFNMGAGENAVLQLLHEIMRAGHGALIVVDEIELGLHVQAQCRLMGVLKELCTKYCCQIICSSHSANVLASLPPEGRILLSRRTNSIAITYGVSPEMAMSELSGKIQSELAIFVEDKVGKDLIQASLPNEMRRRVEIKSLGSANSSILYAAATHLREGERNFIIFLDGDQRESKEKLINRIVELLNDCSTINPDSIRRFLAPRISFLPGSSWPEKVVFEGLFKASGLPQLLIESNISDLSELKSYISSSICAGKHNEFKQFANSVHLEEDTIRMSCIRQYLISFPAERQIIIDNVNNSLCNNYLQPCLSNDVSS